jgi:hypothetical protein
LFACFGNPVEFVPGFFNGFFQPGHRTGIDPFQQPLVSDQFFIGFGAEPRQHIRKFLAARLDEAGRSAALDLHGMDQVARRHRHFHDAVRLDRILVAAQAIPNQCTGR